MSGLNSYVHINSFLSNVVPTPNITTIPSNSIQGAMVGSPQDIQCIVSTVSDLEMSSVMISWMGPEGRSFTNDSRVTISPTTSSGNNYTSSLQFTYLMEGDEGMYTCDVIIEANNSVSNNSISNISVSNNSVLLELVNLTGKLSFKLLLSK